MQTIGPYKLLHNLHLYDEVYSMQFWRAERTSPLPNRFCTVVFPRPDLAHSTVLLDAFRDDGAEVLRQRHRRILCASELAMYGNLPLIELEQYSGVTIGTLLGRNPQGLPPSAAIQIVYELAGIPHAILSTLFLQTGTVLVVRPGHVLVLPRFSRVYRYNVPSFTFSPEFYELGIPPLFEDPTNESAYVYLLASILFSLATGRRYFTTTHENPHDMLARFSLNFPRPSERRLDLAPLDEVIAACTTTQRDRAITTFAQLRKRLESIPEFFNPTALASILDAAQEKGA